MLVVLLESVDWDHVRDVELLLSEVEAEPMGVGSPLTERQTDVLELIAAGFTNAEIAKRLGISSNTVAHHVKSILAKTRASNRTAAASYGVARGMIQGASLN